VSFCRKQGIAPHVAERSDHRVKGLDGRATRTKHYQTSQVIRKRVEECIGWIKEIGGLRRVKVRGTERGERPEKAAAGDVCPDAGKSGKRARTPSAPNRFCGGGAL
jgi:hypothetical protein